MLVICFDKNRLVGGFGDRVVGIISLKLISKLIGQKFFIQWTKEDIKEFFNYEVCPELPENVKIYNCIDNQKRLKSHLVQAKIFFPDSINIFYLNQEISQYLYKNKQFEKYNYLKDILSEYKNLYSHTLIPTDQFLKKVDDYVGDTNNITGIQIRCGDRFMATNKKETHETGTHKFIKAYLLKIREHLDDNDKVFFTSDHPKAIKIALKVFGKRNTIYNPDLIQHLDRNSINKDISKIFIDSYILSQKTSKLFISEHSNFGRVAALSSTHDKIFDLECNPIIKKNLLTKHELVF